MTPPSFASQEKEITGENNGAKIVSTIAFTSFALVLMLAATWQAQAQDAKALYPTMAPIEQYPMERNAEIALARSAAPESISKDAEVLALGRHGYETAVKGKNGFVCMVERSWTAGIDDPDFWNPKLRLRSASTRRPHDPTFHLLSRKPRWYWLGDPKPRCSRPQSRFRQKGIAAPEPGSMCYMMSKQEYLNDRDGHWHPHLMFFVPLDRDLGREPAGFPGSGSRGHPGTG